MKKTINIGDKAVEFNASAATPIYYKRAFKSDMLKDLQGLSTEDIDVSILYQLAFAMTDDCKQGRDLAEWLDQFDMVEFLQATEQIMSLIADNSATSIETETKNLQATEK